jgi:hypothetical protein
MKNINELALPTLGTTGTTGTIGTNAATAGSPTAISNAISALSKTIAAAGGNVDPAVKQTLLNLQKAHAVAAQKAVKIAQDAAKQAQQAATTSPSTQPKPPGQADEEDAEGLNNSMAKKKLSPAQKKLASAAAPKDKITGADFKALKKESNDNIINFLKSISQKKYAQADKYLQSAVDLKLKASINRAVENSK